MKKTIVAIMVMVLGLTAIMPFTQTAMASTNADYCSPTIARTKAWDAILYTLGGVPESVIKIEYEGSTFYLGNDITETEFLAVLTAGPEAVNMKPPQENGMLYNYPAYILWNSDKTIILVHPIRYDIDAVLEAVAIPTDPPENLTRAQVTSEAKKTELSVDETVKYMLSKEYADAVRTEFYRLLNEHRVANGLSKLEINEDLQGYADIRADEQSTRFGHTRPDGSRAGSGWHNSQNFLNTRYAENVIGTGALSTEPKNTALSIFNRWKNSAGHNRHMLYSFDPQIKMAFGIAPKLDSNGFVVSGGVFATGY